MGSIWDWSKTAASNANSDSAINWTEGQAPSTVNNSARAEMGRVAEFRDDLSGVVTVGGSANAVTVTANSAFVSYSTGLRLAFKAGSTNTDVATLNVNAIGAKSIRRFGPGGEQPLAAGDIQANSRYDVIYDTAVNGGAGGWILLSPSQSFKPSFFAHRNSITQNPIASATPTKFGPTTELFDVGNAFSLANGRWTPPAGIVHLAGTIYFDGTNVAANGAFIASIYKNGSAFRNGAFTRAVAAGASVGTSVEVIDQANGTDYYELWVYGTTSVGGLVLNGDPANTYFCGHVV